MSDLVNALNTQARSGSVLDAIAHPAQINLLGAYQGAATTAGDIYRLRGLQAQQAMGEAYQQAVDPQTGRFDPLKFNTLLSQSPAAAMSAQSGIESSQKLQGEQFNLNDAQRNRVNSVVTSALNIQDPAQRADYLARSGADLINSGVVPADRVGAALIHMPPPSDPAGQERYLRALQYSTYSTEQRQQLTEGTPHLIDTGSGYQPGIVSGRTGAFTPAGQPITKGVPPEVSTQVGYVTDLNPNSPTHGQQIPITERDKRIAAGADPSLFGAPQGPMGNGRYNTVPPALRGSPPPPPAPATTAAPATAAPPTTTTATPPPAPATTAAPTTTGAPTAKPYTTPSGVSIVGPSPAQNFQMANSPKMFQADVDAGVESKNRAATLGNMLTASRQFVTGPGQFETAKNALMSTFPGLGRFVGLTNESVAAANDFSKLSAQLVAAQNAGSDKRMDLIEAATPSIVKSPEGVDLIIRQLQGNEDYLQARAKLAQKYPDQNDYRGFQAQLQQLDPRVFQYQRMTQPQRDAWRAHTDKRTVDEITASAAFAKQQGLL